MNKSNQQDRSKLMNDLHLNGSEHVDEEQFESTMIGSIISNREQRVNELKQKLKFPATLLTRKELNLYYEMGSSPKVIRKESLTRMLISASFGIIFLALVNSSILMLIGAFVMPLLIWRLSEKTIESQHELVMFKKRLNFNKFVSITTPYLSQIKDGISIISILNDVSYRTNDEHTLESIGKLVSAIRQRPMAIDPYLEFARTMDDTQRASIFMTAMYQMSQGAASDQTAKNLSEQANNDLMKQIDKIEEAKIKKFHKLPTLIVMGFGIYMMGFLGGILLSVLKQVMK